MSLLNFIEQIDERILALFTKFSHWFQRLTGRTNYFLAKISLGLLFSADLLEVANYWFPVLARPTHAVDVILDASVDLFFLVRWLNLLEKAENDAERMSDIKSPIHAVLGSLGDEPLRIFRVVGVILFTLNIKKHLSSVFLKGFWLFNLHHELVTLYMILFMYLITVDPLPPGISRIRQWIEDFQAGFRRLQPIQPTR